VTAHVVGAPQAAQQWGLDLALPDVAGFRLWNLELLNWGTFDGAIHRFPIEGCDTFVTGHVGAGKSTIVDALTTLFVPTSKLVYNQAAGADRGERRLDTYLRGTYSTQADDAGASSKPVSLRGTTHVSAVLAHFRDDASGTDATFAQIFYFTGTGIVGRVHAVADKPVTIEELLAGANSDTRRLHAKIRTRMTELGTWKEYIAAVRKRLGLPHEQALDLWFKTVSMKQVGNLTAFVRSHMLEPPDETEAKIVSLVAHYQDLTAAAAAIAKAREQLGILDPLVTALDDHHRHAKDADVWLRLRDRYLEGFYQRLEIDIVAVEIGLAEGRLATANARVSSLQTQIASDERRVSTLDKAINDQGGAALAQVETDIEQAEASLQTRRERRLLYEERCNEAGVDPADGLDAFTAQRAHVQVLHDQAAERAEQGGEYDQIAALSKAREELREVSGQIETLRHRKSNIEVGLLSVRTLIAQAIGADEADLPFAGELLQVRPQRREWEPAAQRLMRGFGLSLLVPDHLYSQVAAYVDQTNLRARLVYHRVPEEARPARRSGPGTLPEIFEIMPTSPMRDWLAGEVTRRFEYTLAESTAAFTAADQAITRTGQFKARTRHEKDDRFGLGDQRRYVLGWDNQGKVAALSHHAEELEREVRRLDVALDAVVEEKRKHQKVVNATDALLREYTEFAAVDAASALAARDDLLGQRKTLLSKSSSLTALMEQKAAREAERDKKKGYYDIANKAVGRHEGTLQDLSTRGQSLPEVPPELPVDAISTLTAVHAEVEQHAGTTSLSTVDRAKQASRQLLQGEIDTITKRATRASVNAVGLMQKFSSAYPGDAVDMDATLESAADFRRVHQRLVEDDLPRFEAEFKKQLSENTMREVAGFNQHLHVSSKRINDHVERINKSLAGIRYTPTTYIRLEATTSADVDIRDFKRDLRECIDGALSGDGDAYITDRFPKVQAIVERFRGREARAEEDKRWTARVTDVRNWYTFAIVERDRDTDASVAHYSDSDGKSGGEKEKLAYTVLAAALSYQFGLVAGDPRSRTFRFVAIDEAFARGSDASTRFALELFDKMGLQLLIVTPLQKKEVIAPYVERVGLIVQEQDHRSRVIFMKIEDYRERLTAGTQGLRPAAEV
jgi:uncharacterized protein YPO0396